MNSAVRAELSLRRTVNYAMQQNDVPVILGCRVVNDSARPLSDVVVTFTAEPPFAEPLEVRIERIEPESAYRLSSVDLILKPDYLKSLEERLQGLLRVEVSSGGETLFRHTEKLAVLACDEWSGIGVLPELLAAFVMPNHPAVEQILAGASDLLKRSGKGVSLSGYQTGRKEHVLLMTEAIFRAVQELQTHYVNPPASFEESGQKIRTPGRIVENRLGTCLDLATLFAACLEEAGLHPLICITEGHAFPGVWLENHCFASAASDDALALRKRVELGEICVFESTLATVDSRADFRTAREAALRLLRDGSPFRCVVDIHRARSARIRPLPSGVRTEAQSAELPATGGFVDEWSVDVVEEASQAAAAASETEARRPDTPAERLRRWKQKLLDLSKSNRLLNFRPSKRKTVPLLVPDLAALVSALAKGDEFTVTVPPPELRDKGPRDYDLHRVRRHEDIPAGVLEAEMDRGRLTASLEDRADLQRRLLELYREARSSIEEGGANTLFLAVGFLAWREQDGAGERHLAPLVLVPLEIRRKSVHDPFQLRQADEEASVNVTLLELLRHDFGAQVAGLEDAVREDGSLDANRVLRAFRRLVKEWDGWEVIEDVCISLFSFRKYLMWKDLEDREEIIRENELVRHLIETPLEPYRDQGEFPSPETLDDSYSPADVLCPLDADASQLAAVLAAAEGKTFVLQGPPGTGKSQTIANIIAHCVASGKTVLFVSEKMAALEVVYRRLSQAGLAEFCLELHSSKSNKKSVLESLGAAFRTAGEGSPEDWKKEALELAKARKRLNDYVRALHLRRDIGQSVFEAISELVRLRGTPYVPIGWDHSRQISQDEFTQMVDVVRDLSIAAREAGPPLLSPWNGAGCREWDLAWESRVLSGIDRLLQTCAPLQNAAGATGSLLGFGEADWSERDLRAMNSVSKALLEHPFLPTVLLTEADWSRLDSELKRWISRGRRRDGLRSQVVARYEREVLRLDLDRLKQRLSDAERSWWLPRQMGILAVRRALSSAMKEREKPDAARMREDIEAALALREEEAFFAETGKRAEELLGHWWREGEPDWDEIEKLRDAASNLRKLAGHAAGADLEKAARLRQQWAELLAEAGQQLSEGGEIAGRLAAYTEVAEAFAEARNALASLLDLDREAVWGPAGESGYLNRVRSTAENWRSNIRSLRTWCLWRASRQKAMDIGLDSVVSAYEKEGIAADRLPAVFRRSFYQWWLEKVLQQEPVLKSFSGPLFDKTIRDFQNLDRRFLELTRQEIRARLAAEVPRNTHKAAGTSETGILQHELVKKARHRPIRKLFQSIPNLLPRLKPCLLMSPLSVAQYLDLSLPKWDLVVFDEASQIPVWDAVGAISRGSQAVIVGDSKQLPPTTFFMHLDDPNDNGFDEESVEDQESILDQCLAARVPQRYLEWHYRSRHESLIAFSNRNYYDNRLLIFPSPHREIGVQLRPVEGVYDRAHSRTNTAEAEALVAEIVERLTDPARRLDTIGVVTFNINQQRLIEDLLEQARSENPDIEQYFDPETAPAGEAVFVKNLETVQGDERDVILLSVCYGPDEAGKVSMNFGPLNREGGERRLNVAVTRARKELLVFSTLRADQIDLSRTQSVGVSHLKDFLDFAERGEQALREQVAADPSAECESFLEEEVCRALRDRGYRVHPQVGCSGYRIDLAIVHPEQPGRYLLGVECDGANYHRAKTARDRDRLREMVLRDLGWRLHRIWSTEWWRDPEREMEKLEEAIRNALSDSGRDPEPSVATAVSHRQEKKIASAQPLRTGGPSPTTGLADERLPVYKPMHIKRRLGDPARFHWERASRISQILEAVVDAEGPISLDLATRRVAAHWRIERVGTKVAERVREIAERCPLQRTKHGSSVFLWPKGVPPEQYRAFRVANQDPASRREPEDLPPEEVANAAAYLLRDMVGVSEEDLVRKTARLFGFERTGKDVAASMRAGIKFLVSRGDAVLNNGRVVLP